MGVTAGFTRYTALVLFPSAPLSAITIQPGNPSVPVQLEGVKARSIGSSSPAPLNWLMTVSGVFADQGALSRMSAWVPSFTHQRVPSGAITRPDGLFRLPTTGVGSTPQLPLATL